MKHNINIVTSTLDLTYISRDYHTTINMIKLWYVAEHGCPLEVDDEFLTRKVSDSLSNFDDYIMTKEKAYVYVRDVS